MIKLSTSVVMTLMIRSIRASSTQQCPATGGCEGGSWGLLASDLCRTAYEDYGAPTLTRSDQHCSVSTSRGKTIINTHRYGILRDYSRTRYLLVEPVERKTLRQCGFSTGHSNLLSSSAYNSIDLAQRCEDYGPNTVKYSKSGLGCVTGTCIKR